MKYSTLVKVFMRDKDNYQFRLNVNYNNNVWSNLIFT